jgi:hypothetical protein
MGALGRPRSRVFRLKPGVRGPLLETLQDVIA